MNGHNKLSELRKTLHEMGSALIAFSGGVDSTFLLKIAHDELKDKAVACTALSESFPQHELEESKELATLIGARQILIGTKELEDENYRANSTERCYFCKKELFEKLIPIAQKEGLEYVVYGEIADDKLDYRPGSRAAREMKIRAPLAEIGFTKEEIRTISKALELPTWNKPAFACLSSRIPHGQAVTAEKLGSIERAEDIIRSTGIRQFRVRHHDGIARIEVDPSDFDKLLLYREKIVSEIRKLGFKFVTLDIEGYKRGGAKS